MNDNNKENKTLKKSLNGLIILILLLISIILSIIFAITKKRDIEKTSIKNVVVIDIKDTLTYKTCLPIVTAIREYSNMSNIKAAILRINSPGGTVAGVQELYREILEFRKKGKIVISTIGDIAASGGYYIAMASDFIIANPGSIVGSVGVIMNTFNLSRLAERFGVQQIVIKAGRFKDILNIFKQIDQQEINLLQQMVNNTYNQFFDVVKLSRKNVEENKLKELCDGRIFTGQMAYEYKMVDALGGYYTAIEKIREILKLPDIPNILIHKTETGFDLMNILKKDGARTLFENLKILFTTGELSTPLYYLYMGY